MASGQGGVGAVTALQSHHYSGGPHWSPGIGQYQQPQPQQQQQQHHTARSLDRALEDAVCSGILNLSGRKLREYPGMSYDLTDTTQAGGSQTPMCLFIYMCVCICVWVYYRKNERTDLCVHGCSAPALCADPWIKGAGFKGDLCMHVQGPHPLLHKGLGCCFLCVCGCFDRRGKTLFSSAPPPSLPPPLRRTNETGRRTLSQALRSGLHTQSCGGCGTGLLGQNMNEVRL